MIGILHLVFFGLTSENENYTQYPHAFCINVSLFFHLSIFTLIDNQTIIVT